MAYVVTVNMALEADDLADALEIEDAVRQADEAGRLMANGWSFGLLDVRHDEEV
jgi:hypothetical protein